MADLRKKTSISQVMDGTLLQSAGFCFLAIKTGSCFRG